MNIVELTRIGNRLGLVLPDELLHSLKLSEGERLLVTASPSGLVLSPYRPEAAEQVAAGRKFMERYQETFKDLAK